MKIFNFFLMKLFLFCVFNLNAFQETNNCKHNDFKKSESIDESINLKKDLVLGVKLDSNYTDNWYLVTFNTSFLDEKISMILNEEQILTKFFDEKEIKNIFPAYNKEYSFSKEDIANLDKGVIKKFLGELKIKTKDLCVGNSLFCYYDKLVVSDIKKLRLNRNIISKDLEDNNYLFFKSIGKDSSFIKRFFSKDHLHFMSKHLFFSSLITLPLTLSSFLHKSFDSNDFFKKFFYYFCANIAIGEVLYNVVKITDNFICYLKACNNKLSFLDIGSIYPLTINCLLNNKHKFETIKIVEVNYLDEKTINTNKKYIHNNVMRSLLDENNNEIKNDKNLSAFIKINKL